MTLTRKNGNNTGSLAKSLGLFGQLGAVVHVQNEFLESKDVHIQWQLLGQVADPVILGDLLRRRRHLQRICNSNSDIPATPCAPQALAELTTKGARILGMKRTRFQGIG